MEPFAGVKCVFVVEKAFLGAGKHLFAWGTILSRLEDHLSAAERHALERGFFGGERALPSGKTRWSREKVRFRAAKEAFEGWDGRVGWIFLRRGLVHRS